ncbi:MAG: NADH-quinone oxidoreductase subunit NuoK [Bdellovibrionales bacterium]|nr:NADH-quinone oxidoreductase subunit NuoK [Bdellovibrionales bacterium]
MVPLDHVLLVSFALFLIGLVGLFLRKDALTIFLCVELLLNAANVAFVGVARSIGDVTGHVVVLIVIAVAAAEAAIGLSIVIRLHQNKKPLEVQKLNELKG